MERDHEVRTAILRALRDLGKPAGAQQLCEYLAGASFDLRPRTVRLRLLELDREGLTQLASRRSGRVLTPRGLDELAHSNVIEKVGFVSARIDTLVYRMSFSLRTRAGTIVTNLATIPKTAVARALEDMKPVFARKLGLGERIAMAVDGRASGIVRAPPGRAVIATVCSVTVNGIFLKEGIPVTSRFGGLLEVREGRPRRFVELLEYRGTTIDPLEFFIKAGLTRVRAASRTGDGLIGASFREFPSVALDDVMRIRVQMEELGLSGILAVGRPGRPLLDIPVAGGRTGMIVIGGLNPIAALCESGMDVDMQSLAGLENYGLFQSFHTLRDRWPG